MKVDVDVQGMVPRERDRSVVLLIIISVNKVLSLSALPLHRVERRLGFNRAMYSLEPKYKR